MRLQPDEARSAPLQVSALQDVVCARLPESRTPEVLFGSGVSKGQQARQATALVGQTRKPRSFPRCGERAAGAGVASRPSGLLEALPTEGGPYVTRRLLGTTCCNKRAYISCVTRGLPQYVTRCLPGASASDGGAYLQVHRLYVTRRHRPFRPASDS